MQWCCAYKKCAWLADAYHFVLYIRSWNSWNVFACERSGVLVLNMQWFPWKWNVPTIPVVYMYKEYYIYIYLSIDLVLSTVCITCDYVAQLKSCNYIVCWCPVPPLITELSYDYPHVHVHLSGSRQFAHKNFGCYRYTYVVTSSSLGTLLVQEQNEKEK